jgi:hypothetical protein
MMLYHSKQKLTNVITISVLVQKLVLGSFSNLKQLLFLWCKGLNSKATVVKLNILLNGCKIIRTSNGVNIIRKDQSDGSIIILNQ